MKKTRISQNPIITSTMTLWGKSSRLMLLASALFVLFLSSCEDPLKVGENVKPGEDLLSLKSVDIPLSTQEILFDSILVSYPNQRPSVILTGVSHDAEMGDITATGYAQPVISSQTINFAEQPVFKGVEIHGRFSYFYGESFNSQVLNIYKLTELPNDTVGLYADTPALNLGDLLGSDTFDIDPEAKSESDFTIALSNSFGQDLLQKAYSGSVFNSQSEFNNYLNGFAFKGADGNNSILGLDLNLDSTVLNLKFAYPNEDTTRILSFTLGGTSFHHIDFQPGSAFPSGKITPNELFSLNQNKIGLLNGVGIFPVFNLKPYYQFIDTLSSSVEINRADLYMGQTETIEHGNVQLRPPTSLYAYYFDQDNNFVSSEVAGTGFRSIQINTANQLSGGNPQTFGMEKNTYRGDITFFLQSILDGDISTNDYSFVFYPSSNSYLRYTVDRFLLDSGKLHLKIQYTELKNQ